METGNTDKTDGTDKTARGGRFVVCETRSGRYVQTFGRPSEAAAGARLGAASQARKLTRYDALRLARALPVMGLPGDYAIEEV